MTKKELKEVYQVIDSPEKGKYCLHKNFKYVGTISINKSKVIFNNKSYSSIEELEKAIDKYNNTLEYSPNCYDPWLKEDYREELKLQEYIKSLGFIKVGWNNVFGYDYTTYAIKDVYGIDRFSFVVTKKYDAFEGDIHVNISLGSLVSIDYKGLDSAIKAINGILKPNILFLLPHLVNIIKKQEVNFDNIEQCTIQGITPIHIPLKKLIKEELIKTLELL